jgi:hypothetical protein
MGRGSLQHYRSDSTQGSTPAEESSPAGVFFFIASICRGAVRRWTSVTSLAAAATIALAACAGPGNGSRITVSQVESLNDLEALLPLTPDSIVTRYRNFDSLAFREIYRNRLAYLTALIDSLNISMGPLPDSLRIDTLAIDHSFGSFGEAARNGKTIVMSAGYFIAFDDWNILRSVAFHEFGHIAYVLLDSGGKADVETIWNELEASALLYLFRDGEYSGNARFGGHPDENPSELFASAFNLLHNRAPEVRARLAYVEPRHYALIRRLAALAGVAEDQFPKPSK